MKIKINLDSVDESIDTLVKNNLKNQSIPECFGNMSPPLLSSVIDVDVSVLLRHKKEIPADNLVSVDLTKLLVEENKLYKDFMLDINGYMYIKSYKEKIVTEYVNHIKKCMSCKCIDLCDKMTSHYLATIKIDLLGG